MNNLLNFFFPITVVEPTPDASTAYLKQVCLVCKPKSGQEGNVGDVFECSTAAAVAARTDNTDADELFDAGMSKVYILLMDDLDLEDALEGQDSVFWTVLVSSDFSDAEMTDGYANGDITITSYANLVSGTDDAIAVAGVSFVAQAGAATLGTATFQAATDNDTTAASLVAQINAHATASALVTASRVGAVVTITANRIGADGNAIATTYTDNDTNVGATVEGATLTGGSGLVVSGFPGVTGISSNDRAKLDIHKVVSNRCAFYAKTGQEALNMCYAFGKLLSNSTDWKNQQYVSMPYDDDIETVGDAESLFDDRVSFVMTDSEYGNRLALFACESKAIIAPYIIKNLQVNMQSEGLQFISTNQPQYTLKAASLLEDVLQAVIDSYVERQWLVSGNVDITLPNANFVAAGAIDVPTPTAMWRVPTTLTQTE